MIELQRCARCGHSVQQHWGLWCGDCASGMASETINRFMRGLEGKKGPAHQFVPLKEDGKP